MALAEPAAPPPAANPEVGDPSPADQPRPAGSAAAEAALEAPAGRLADRYAAACRELGCRPNSELCAALEAADADAALPAGPELLDLNSNRVGPLGARAVVAVARAMPALRSLRLRDNGLDDGAAVVLAAALGGHPALTELDLRDNLIAHRGGKALLAMAAATPGLRRVELDGSIVNRAVVHRIEALLDARPAPPAE